MAKSGLKTTEEEVVLPQEEVVPPLLNEEVPQIVESGHPSRDFFTPLS